MPALFTRFIGKLIAVRGGFFQVLLKAGIEIPNHLTPFHATFFNIVQFRFHARRKSHVHNVRKAGVQHIHYVVRNRRRIHIFPVFFDVFLHEFGDDRRVRGRSTNPLFFHRLYEGSVRVTKRRFREFLFLLHGEKV